MVMCDHSDGAQLFENNAKSRAGRHQFLRDFASDLQKGAHKLNGPAHALCEILKYIIASEAECRIVSTFKNGQDATLMCKTLIEMDHS